MHLHSVVMSKKKTKGPSLVIVTVTLHMWVLMKHYLFLLVLFPVDNT